jgi:predicted CXXCH cytochrome family protein
MVATGSGLANSILGSKHDLTSLDKHAGTGVMVGVAFEDFQNACVYCHTPHRPKSEPSKGNAPLWNREYPVTEYELYQSPTLDSNISQPSSITLACLSCHDGSLAVDRVLKRPTIKGEQSVPKNHMRIAMGSGDSQCSQCHRKGNENIDGIHDLGIAAFGNNLNNDHPVSINYPSTFGDKQFHPRPGNGEFDNGVKLFNGRVECASCHDVHNAKTKPFLRTGLQGSSLCVTCHIK